MFNDPFGDTPFVLPGEPPPDSVPLGILGLTALPRSTVQLSEAFRRRVRETHPDMADPFNQLHVSERATVAATEEFQQIVWARNALIRRVPRPQTDGSGAVYTFAPRQCEACDRPPGEAHPHPDDQCKGCHGKRETNPRHWKNRLKADWAYWWPGYCYWCVDELENERQREIRRERRENTECVGCATLFTPARSDARYCSSACRQAAYRVRLAD